MTSPTSQRCWEPGQCQWPHFTDGRTKSPSCCLMHLEPHTNSASSQGQAAETSAPSMGHHFLWWLSIPTWARGVGEAAPQQGWHISPHCGAVLGCSKGLPSAGMGGKTPSGTGGFLEGLSPGSAPDGHGCPTHTHTDTASKDHARPRVATVTPCRGLIPTFPGF